MPDKDGNPSKFDLAMKRAGYGDKTVKTVPDGPTLVLPSRHQLPPPDPDEDWEGLGLEQETLDGLLPPRPDDGIVV